jgi:hypothetical protein
VSRTADRPARAAAILVRAYPRAWRARYGDEFIEYLIADLGEQPHSARRTANVIGSGLLARLTGAGLSGHALTPTRQARASLATVTCALAAFLTFGVAMWAQLAIGWQWSEPDATGTINAMVVMSIAVALFLVLALLAAAPVAAHLVRGIVRRQAPHLIRPLLLVLAAGTVLVVGGRHFANGWPGTGGHPWVHQGLVPGGVAAFTWASTLSVSSYWVHPAGLLTFPASELAWMLLSPVALTCLVVGLTKLVHRTELSSRILRYELLLAEVSVIVMIAFLGGAGSWFINGGPGPRNRFHSGLVDVVGVAVMSVALATVWRATQRARGARLDLSGSTAD